MKKKDYSPKTKRHATIYPGVYSRRAERIIGELDTSFDISYGKDGKKVWEKVGWKSQGYSAKLAKTVRDERIRSIRHGDELPKDKKKAPYLKEAWKSYFTWAETNKARCGRDDKYIYENHLKDRFGEKRMDEISSFDLERLKTSLVKARLSAASVKHCLVLIRQIYNKAATWRLYQGANPIKGVKMPTVQNQRTRFLSHEEANRLLEYLKKPKPRLKKDGTPAKIKVAPSTFLYDISVMSLHTGMRVGEIFALKGQDIDLPNGIITIRDPKNKVTRHAYITGAAKEVLARRAPDSPDGLVFADRKGNQAQAVSKNFRNMVATLGLNEGIKDPREMVTFHSLRHTFASLLALQGETLQTIKELLGHKSMAMTERYAHLGSDHKRRATLALEKGFTAKKRKNVVTLAKKKSQRG